MTTVTGILWGVGGIGVVGFVWAAVRWRAAAGRVKAAEAAVGTWVDHSARLQVVVAEKERILVEAETKLVNAADSAALAAELNELFNRPRAGSASAGRAKAGPK